MIRRQTLFEDAILLVCYRDYIVCFWALVNMYGSLGEIYSPSIQPEIMRPSSNGSLKDHKE